jgi:hypothetical protein
VRSWFEQITIPTNPAELIHSPVDNSGRWWFSRWWPGDPDDPGLKVDQRRGTVLGHLTGGLLTALLGQGVGVARLQQRDGFAEHGATRRRTLPTEDHLSRVTAGRRARHRKRRWGGIREIPYAAELAAVVDLLDLDLDLLADLEDVVDVVDALAADELRTSEMCSRPSLPGSRRRTRRRSSS